MDCDGLTKQEQRLLGSQERTVKGVVANTLGSPHNQVPTLKNEIKGIQDRIIALEQIKDAPARDKRRLRKKVKELNKRINLEKKRYKAHRDLNKLISDHVLKLSASTGFAVDPKEYLLVLD